jgi:transcriptional regulator with XRE-family HTH domain
MTADPGLLHVLVRRRRLELGLSQRAAAEAAGVAVGTWQAMERADHQGGFQLLSLTRVAKVLDVPLEELMVAAGVEPDHLPVLPARPSRHRAPGRDPAELVEEITTKLRHLAAVAPDDVALVGRIVDALTSAQRSRSVS